MKFKRILSILLSATLVISCLPIATLANDNVSVASVGEDIWGAGDGSAVTEIVPTDTDPYISLTGRDHGRSDVLIYEDTTPGKYKGNQKDYVISFKIRTREFTSGESSAENNAGKIRIVANKLSGGVELVRSLTLTSEWEEKTYTVAKSSTKGFNGVLYFTGTTSGMYSVAPIEIKDFSIVEKNASTLVNLAGNPTSLYMDGAGWKMDNADDSTNPGVKTLNVAAVSDSKYMSVPASASGSVSIKNSSTEVLPAGIYYISGDFRLSKIDRTLYTFNDSKNLVSDGNISPLTLLVNGNAVRAVSDAVINPEAWTNVLFKVVITEPIAKDKLVFSVNTKCGLDFRNIVIEDKSADYNTEIQNSDGEFLTKPSMDGESYIRVSGRDHADDVVYYKDTVTAYDPEKTYTVSFRIRTRDYIGHDDAGIAEYPAYLRLNANARWGNTIEAGLKLTSEWTFKTYDVAGFNGQLYFISDWHGQFIVPYDIKDFTVVEKGTTDNIAANADKPFIDGAGWDIYSNSGASLKSLEVYTMPRNDYYVVPVGASGTTEFRFTDSTPLAAGIYHVSGNFMLADGEIDFNKYVFQNIGALSADENCETLVASVNGNTIKTLDGESAVKVNLDSWSNASFKFVVNENDSISLNDIVFTLSDSADLFVKNIVVTDASKYYISDFVDGEGNAPAIVDGSNDELYIAIDGRSSNQDMFVYSMRGINAGTYTVRFKVRTKKYIPAEDPIASNPASFRVNYVLNSSNMGAITTFYNLTADWAEKSFNITVDTDNSKIMLKHNGPWQGYGFAPIDIKDFEIINADGENVAVNANGILTDGCGWSAEDNGGSKELTVAVSTDAYHYRVSAPSSGVTKLGIADSEMLDPGVYNISGKFRLVNDGAIDFSKYESNASFLDNDRNIISAKMTAFVGENELKAKSGRVASVNSGTWTEVTFVLNTTVPVSMSDIYLMLDGAYDLDFSDVSVELVERHLEMTPFGNSVVMVLLAYKHKQIEELGLNAPWSISGGTLTVVDKVLDETTGLIGDKKGAASNSYIHISGRDSNSDQLVYKNTTQNLAPGTYNLTFWMRTAELTNKEANYMNGRNPVSVMRLFITGGWKQLSDYAIKRSGAFDTHIGTQLMPTTDWTKYSYTFKLDAETPFIFWFGGNSQGYSVTPFDIDGFKLVKVDPKTYAPITGENLAINSDKLMGAKAGWSVADSGKAYLTTEVNSITESEFMRIESKGEDVITLKNKGAKLAPGKYYITTKVRLSEIDYLKYEYGETVDALVADHNKATLKAYFGGNTLNTTIDKDSADITAEWSVVSFVVDVKEETTMKNLKLTVEGAESVDFDYINVSTKISKTDKDSIAISADGTIVLPPVDVDTDGNLLEGAIDEETLPYWSYGDQKLELKRDEDGVPYLSASNITKNTLGFTYNPRFSVKPGTYTFKADVRTSNKGEKGALRVMIGELYNTVAINSEWKSVQFEFTIPDEMSEFSIKLRGGAFSTSIQDYEFKNLSLISVVSTLKGINIFENGEFNDEAAALDAWVYGRSSGKLTVNNEGDNKFLTSSERVDCNSAIDAKVGYPAFAGVKYMISYDIRTTHEGDTMQARTSVASGGVNTDLNFNGGHFFDITHEWLHVEYTYVPSAGGEMLLRIAGGWRGEPDDKDYDIDNIRIEIIG